MQSLMEVFYEVPLSDILHFKYYYVHVLNVQFRIVKTLENVASQH